MSYSLRFILFLFFTNAFVSNGQTNITKEWKDASPVKEELTATTVEKLKTYSSFLEQAVSIKDVTLQFYGNIYLYTHFMDEQNYPAALPYLLRAENIANQSGNKSWKGFVKLRTGWVANIVQNDVKAAIEEFKIGAAMCAEAKDSLCMACCYEQLSAMYSGQNEFAKSHYYFNLAIPILRKSEYIKLDAFYSNHSSLLIREGKLVEALLYIDSATRIVQKQNNRRKEDFYLINKAIVLSELKFYDSAETVYKYCLAEDEKNEWMENLLYDYEGLSQNYNAMGNHAAAYEYLNKFITLKDSLSGVKVNIKVAGIIAAHKSELDKLVLKNNLVKRNWIISAILFLLMLALLLWRIQYVRDKKDLLKNKKNLDELTRILIAKNSQISDLEIEVNNLNQPLVAENKEEKEEIKKIESLSEEHPDFEANLYNQRILTNADWAAFKISFNKVYPGYLPRLRNTYPNLTEAEERMFLFIKMKLTNKEAAAIVGISAESIKKTRSRLRKRIGLQEDVDLDDFINNF